MRRSIWVLCVILVGILALALAAVAQKATLKLAYEGEYFVRIADEFMKRNPDVKIESSVMGLDAIESGALKLALGTGTGPDIIQIDSAPARMGLFANAGLFLPLDEYYSKFGWEGKVFPWTLRWVTYKGGKKYGIPYEVEIIGPLYNKGIFDKVGLTAPKTYEDFASALKKLSGAGYIPIALGTKNKYGGGHIYSNIIEATAGRDRVEDMLFGDGRWDQPRFNQAAEILQDWVKKGYALKEANTLDDSEATTLLWEQKAAMKITGSWLTAQVIEHSSLSLDFFILPPANPDVPGRFTGGLGSGYSISAKTKYPDVAAKFLDFAFFNKEGQKIIFEVGNHIPCVYTDVKEFNIHPFFKSVIEKANDPRGIGYNLSVVIPADVKNVYYEVIQGLVGMMIAPEQANKQIQKAWEKAKAEGLVQQ
ncbi:MAG: ABC transporter substrate-binding protein [bacterium]